MAALTLQNSDLLQTRLFIDGNWKDAADGERFAVTNPADGQELAQVARGGAEDAERAIAAAHRALPDWRRRTAAERSALLRRWHGLIMQNQEDLARLLTAEQGKPLAEAKGEIAYGASFIEWFAEEAKRIYGDTIPGPDPQTRIVVLKQPVGVVAAITPWNFPNAMLARKVGAALAVGCTAVCKPASATPLSALALGELARQAGIPDGVVNVIAGKTREIGETLTHHPDVRKITFTGSTSVGKELVRQATSTMKRTSMELGGNAPFIVFDDADIDAAVDGAVASKFRNAGQTCVCANRILVQDKIYDAFAEKMLAKVKEFELGDGLREGVTMGPLIDSDAAAGVRELIDDARSAGAEILSGGQRADRDNFVTPVVLTNARQNMRVFNEEIFGPVAPLYRFHDDEEAIQLANDTPVGLASYFYARDVGRIWRVSEGLEYGIVGVNTGMISNAAAPFGGVKESGHGREGSKYGVEDYLDIKYVAMGGL